MALMPHSLGPIPPTPHRLREDVWPVVLECYANASEEDAVRETMEYMVAHSISPSLGALKSTVLCFGRACHWQEMEDVAKV